MAAAAGIFNREMTAGQALTGKGGTTIASSSPATSSTSGSSGSSDSSSSSATISANDFLTLLVTEMQNQDPTADTDPNEYINQLVQVNSLEQLIDINQTLTADSTPASSSTGGSGTPQSAGARQSTAGTSLAGPSGHSAVTGPKPSALTAAQSAAVTGSTGSQTAVKRAPGNLSAPNAKPAALRVAHALDGRSHVHR